MLFRITYARRYCEASQHSLSTEHMGWTILLEHINRMILSSSSPTYSHIKCHILLTSPLLQPSPMRTSVANWFRLLMHWSYIRQILLAFSKVALSMFTETDVFLNNENLALPNQAHTYTCH